MIRAVLVGLALGTATAAIVSPPLGLVVGGASLILMVTYFGLAALPLGEARARGDFGLGAPGGREPDAPQPRRRPRARVVVLHAPVDERPPTLAPARNVVVTGRPWAPGPRFGATSGVKETDIDV